MKMTRDFCSGFASAVSELGREGDSRGKNWSEAYKYLHGRLHAFEPLGDSLIEQLRFRGGLCVEAANEIERLQKALEAAGKCRDCGKPLSSNCPHCQRQWES